MKKHFSTKNLVLLALLVGILLLMSYTPLGYLNLGPLAVTFNMIPVAIAAITLGPVGGAIAGSVFGITSCLQCVGIGGSSALGTILFGIDPFLAIVQRFVPRLLTGLLIGYIYRFVNKRANPHVACAVTGFFAAFLNTLFFMAALLLLFGNTEYILGEIAGKNPILWACVYVGFNAVAEMIASTMLTAAIGVALQKAGLIRRAK